MTAAAISAPNVVRRTRAGGRGGAIGKRAPQSRYWTRRDTRPLDPSQTPCGFKSAGHSTTRIYLPQINYPSRGDAPRLARCALETPYFSEIPNKVKRRKSLLLLARPKGFEPLTP